MTFFDMVASEVFCYIAVELFFNCKNPKIMPKFIIERNMPGVGQSTPQEMKGACQKSNDTLRNMSSEVQWQQSYVIGDKLYCVYIAGNKEAVQEHATKSGFPADRIEAVTTIIDPTSAE